MIQLSELSEKDREDVLRIISRPPRTSEDLDNCPVTQECRRIKEKVGREYLRDPEKFRARSRALAKELGIEIVSAPWYKVMFRRLRRRLAAEKAAKKRTAALNTLKKVSSN